MVVPTIMLILLELDRHLSLQVGYLWLPLESALMIAGGCLLFVQAALWQARSKVLSSGFYGLSVYSAKPVK